MVHYNLGRQVVGLCPLFRFIGTRRFGVWSRGYLLKHWVKLLGLAYSEEHK